MRAELPSELRQSYSYWLDNEFSRIELVDTLFTPPDQEPAQNADAPAPRMPFGSQLVTVHGVVRNAATGEPLARAMVRIEGDAATGALTDGEGRFEIAGLQAGPQLFEVVKPGFQDRPSAAGMVAMDEAASSAHNVIVAADMPDLDFTLAPTCAIRGHVELSTGDPAQGIQVMLLRRAVQDGRGVWQGANSTKTLSDGTYRFAGLPEGIYAVYTLPAMDSESIINQVAAVKGSKVDREGYASVFYPDARDLAGAAKIHLESGEQVQANLNLALEPFHAITATATLPEARTGSADRPGMNYSAEVMDAEGHHLAYVAQYDAATSTIQAMLPDGTYSLGLTATARFGARFSPGGEARAFAMSMEPHVGSVEFSVAGHAISNLRVPLSVPRMSSVQLTVLHSSSGSAEPSSNQDRGVVVTVSEASGWMEDGMSSNFAQGAATGPMDAYYTAPGSYWVHTHVVQKGWCVGTFTAGGVDLAREPVVVTPSGVTAPMELTVRDDCAKLTLSLPPALAAITIGEERYYTVYAVPDFDSTVDVEPVTLRPTSGATMTIEGLTPGSYHVYAFTSPVALEYRNRQALAGLPIQGQAIELSAGATTSHVLEEPPH